MVDLNQKGVWSDAKGRREFVSTLLKAAAGSGLLMLPAVGIAAHTSAPSLTVQQVIDLILKDIPGAPFKQTVDTIKAGNASDSVSGIVTTMFATAEVIEKTAALGANFIIAHEPTFYNHADDTTAFQNDEVYKYKLALLNKNKITVWRFHDYIHAHKPDGVVMGVLQAVGWEKYYDGGNPYVLTIPAASVDSIIQLFKSKLNIPHVRMVGKKDAVCTKVVFAPGAAGGPRQIEIIRKEQPDLFICGEVNEWETSEYVRDLRRMGGKTSLVVLGHIVSEEPGLQWLVSWLQPKVPGIKITHIPSTDAFTWA